MCVILELSSVVNCITTSGIGGMTDSALFGMFAYDHGIKSETSENMLTLSDDQV